MRKKYNYTEVGHNTFDYKGYSIKFDGTDFVCKISGKEHKYTKIYNAIRAIEVHLAKKPKPIEKKVIKEIARNAAKDVIGIVENISKERKKQPDKCGCRQKGFIDVQNALNMKIVKEINAIKAKLDYQGARQQRMDSRQDLLKETMLKLDKCQTGLNQSAMEKICDVEKKIKRNLWMDLLACVISVIIVVAGYTILSLLWR